MADRYWVGGTASWDATVGTKWAASSGGTGGETVPTSSDRVFFDANSGAVTVTVATVAANCDDITFTGFTGTFTGSVALNVYGSFTLVSGMTWTYTGQITFRATTTGETITTAGKIISQISGNLTFDGVGGEWTLQDNYTGSAMTFTNGTFNSADKAIDSSSRGLVQLGVGTKTINAGASVWNAQRWFFINNTANTTFNAGSSNIIVDESNYFDGGDFTYNIVTITSASDVNLSGNNTIATLVIGNSGTGEVRLTGSNTILSFLDNCSNAHTLIFYAGTTQQISIFKTSGSVGNLTTINSDTTDTHTLVKVGGGTISRDFLNIQHSVATPGNVWFAGANSVNNQSVVSGGSGWIFSDPPAVLSENAAEVGGSQGHVYQVSKVVGY